MHIARRRSTNQHLSTTGPKIGTRKLVLSALIAALLAPTAVVGDPDRGGAIAAARPRGTDFNGDGYDELVIADSRFDSGAVESGAVWVVPGSPTGLRPADVSGWSQSRAGMAGDPADSDRFGQAWTAGDFNADAYDDLAVCIPGESVAGVSGAGAVSIIFGSATGLRATNSKLLSRAIAGIPGSPTANEAWCDSGLVTGDFNADRRDDIAISSPFAAVDAHPAAGSLTVLLSSTTGPSGVGAVEISQAPADVPGSPQDFGWFSQLGLGSGDFNGDGYDDLSVSAHRTDQDGYGQAGGVYVFRGSRDGIRTAGTQLITRASPGIPGNSVTSAFFGLGFPAIADWNHDGYDDLVIPDPRATVDGVDIAGQIVLLRGSPTGLVGAGGKTIHQSSPGVPGIAEYRDFFGYQTLTSGDFDRDGRPDLAVSVEAEDVGAGVDAGAFYTFPGTASSIGTTGTRLFTQDTEGVPGAPAFSAFFSGVHLWSGDFNGDGYDDLVVPCSSCGIGALPSAGYVMVFRGSANGITTIGLRQIKRSSLPGMSDEAGTAFGAAD